MLHRPSSPVRRQRVRKSRLLYACIVTPLFLAWGCGYLGVDLDGDNVNILGGAPGVMDEDPNEGSGGSDDVTHSGGSSEDEPPLGGTSSDGGDSGDGDSGDGDSGGAESGGSEMGGASTGGGTTTMGTGGATGGSAAGGGESGGTGGSVTGGTGGTSTGGSGGSTPTGGTGGAPGAGGWGTGGEWDPTCSGRDFSEPERIEGLDISGDKWGPSVSGDGLTLYFAVSSGTNEEIYRSHRTSRDSEFGPAEKVIEIDIAGRQGSPFIMPDESRLYFFVQDTADQNSRDLYYSDFNELLDLLGAFGPPQTMPYMSIPGYRDHQPWVSGDGLTIYMASSRNSSDSWETDIWMGSRTNTDVGFGTPSLVTELQSDFEEASPSLTPDQLVIYFASDRLAPGEGPGDDDFDVWQASRLDTESPFTNISRVTALSADGADELNLNLSPDGDEIYLSSDRSGSQELWVARRECWENWWSGRQRWWGDN